MTYIKRLLIGVITTIAVVSSFVALQLRIDKTDLLMDLEMVGKKKEKIEKTLYAKETELKNTKEEINNIKIENGKKDKTIKQLKEEIEILKKKINSKGVPKYSSDDLRIKSNINTTQIDNVLEGTGLQGLGWAYKKAEEIYGVNAIFLISLTAEESGWGESDRAVNDNNLSGYGVYTSTSRGARFNSKGESILKTARLIGEEYLKPEGAHFNGYSIYEVNKKYCTTGGTSWSNNINNIANKIVKKIK